VCRHVMGVVGGRDGFGGGVGGTESVKQSIGIQSGRRRSSNQFGDGLQYYMILRAVEV